MDTERGMFTRYLLVKMKLDILGKRAKIPLSVAFIEIKFDCLLKKVFSISYCGMIEISPNEALVLWKILPVLSVSTCAIKQNLTLEIKGQ